VSLESALAYLDGNHERFQTELIELLRIPSISIDPAYQPEIDKAANWLANKLREMRVQNVEILPTEQHPVVYGEWLNGGASAPTVLVYGHYDVQPPEPLEDWKSNPFEPEIRDENLYARGATDMKGQILASVNAVEAIMKTGVPVNIKFVLEGEEEIGSKHLPAFLSAHHEKLACDFSLNTDAGGMPDPDTPSICYSLRGGAGFLLEIFGPSQDIHSGEYGGVIQNPIHVMSKLIADLHDEQGHVTLPGFYDRVQLIDDDERAELARLPFNEASFLLKHSGAPALWGEPDYIPAERIGARPTFEVLQFTAGQPKSAIPAKATARLSFRLVPDQDPQEVHQQLRQYLETCLPSTVTWNLQMTGGGPAVITNYKSPEVQAMKQALQTAFGRQPILQRGGGGIGAVSMFKQILGIDSVLTGFSLMDDNLHGPNEKLHLPAWRKGMAALVHFFYKLSTP
jgi:acetylornithine deacetylase/succinyl-diaminopimelate desuccinylase-like protein